MSEYAVGVSILIAYYSGVMFIMPTVAQYGVKLLAVINSKLTTRNTSCYNDIC